MKESLRIEGLRISFPSPSGELVRAVEDAGLTVPPATALGLVGESGCGKTLTGLAVLRLLPPAARLERGRIFLGETDLSELTEAEMRAVRGEQVAMIFQEPMTSLNPVYRVGDQVVEAIRAHRRLSFASARHLALDLLDRVGIRRPRERYQAYPHQLSGGQRQRVMIATALSCSPRFLIADEPTTALDVTVQARILELIASLRERERMGILLITHDLGIVAGETDRVAVMYLGRMVEEGATRDVFARPLHPYARALLRSVPRLGQGRRRLEAIRGNVPTPALRPSGCPFHPRCPLMIPVCRREIPPLKVYESGHRCACFRAGEEAT